MSPPANGHRVQHLRSRFHRKTFLLRSRSRDPLRLVIRWVFQCLYLTLQDSTLEMEAVSRMLSVRTLLVMAILKTAKLTFHLARSQVCSQWRVVFILLFSWT